MSLFPWKEARLQAMGFPQNSALSQPWRFSQHHSQLTRLCASSAQGKGKFTPQATVEFNLHNSLNVCCKLANHVCASLKLKPALDHGIFLIGTSLKIRWESIRQARNDSKNSR